MKGSELYIIYAFLTRRLNRLVGGKMEYITCECESKSYSIPEIKVYSPPHYMKDCIPGYLKEKWNFFSL